MNNSVSRLLFAGSLAFFLLGCSGGSDGDGITGVFTPGPSQSLNGVAQKGPFQPGASATLSAFDADRPVEESFTQTVDEFGRYSFENTSLPGVAAADGFQIRVTGRYFDETTGTFSNIDRTLRGLFRLSIGNVNLFTHIMAARTAVLMGGNGGFDAASTQARVEFEQIFGISAATSDLDLLEDSTNEDDSANLLLFSAAILAAGINQMGIESIANDFGDDGLINGNGLGPLNLARQAVADNPNLLSEARLRLQNQYGVTPPDDTDGQLPAWAPPEDGGDDGMPGGGDGNTGGGSGGSDDLAENTVTGDVDGVIFSYDQACVFAYEPGVSVNFQTPEYAPLQSPGRDGGWSIRFDEGLTGNKRCTVPDPSDPVDDPGDAGVSYSRARSDSGSTLEGIFGSPNITTENRPERIGECTVTITRSEGPGGTFAGFFTGTLYPIPRSSADIEGTTPPVDVINGEFNVTLPIDPIEPDGQTCVETQSMQ